MAGALGLAGCVAAPALDDGPAERRLTVEDGFVFGANYPWRHYGHDFGRNGWGYDGVATDGAGVEADLAAIAEARGRVVRWFVFADGRAGIDWDGERPVGLQPEVYDDFDAALRAAEDAGVWLLPTLLDFHWFAAARQVDGVQLGGRAATVDEHRQAWLDTLAPFLDRYGAEPAIFAWDLVNEPGWITDGRGLGPHGVDVPRADLVAFVQAMADAVHDRCEQPVTLGSAKAEWLSIWDEVDLDLAQIHWYEPVVLGLGAEALSPDRPLLLGEVATSDPQLAAHLDAAAALGYAGVLPWSFGAEDEATAWDCRENEETHIAD